MVSTR
jgi:predicted ester cyclase